MLKQEKRNGILRNFFKTLGRPFQALAADDVSDEKELEEELKKLEEVQRQLHKGKEEDYISNLKVVDRTDRKKAKVVKQKENTKNKDEIEIGD